MRYFEDDNFITKVGDGKVTTIAKATGESTTLKIGDYTFAGPKLTQEWYDTLLAKCDKEDSENPSKEEYDWDDLEEEQDLADTDDSTEGYDPGDDE